MNDKKKQLWAFLCFLMGVFVLLCWAWYSAWPAPILSVDIKQERLNKALPLPQNGVEIRQEFYARYDGLREVEVQLARFEREDEGGQLSFRLFDDQDQLVAERMVKTRSLTHNQIWVWHIPRQDESAERRYTLLVTGDGPFSLWGYTLDVLSGELDVSGAKTEARELRFVTRYELTFGAAIKQLVALLQRDGLFLGLALGFVLMPGCLILLLTRRWLGEWDLAAWWGGALALGLSLWPLIWYWMTLAGLRWSRFGLWVVLLWGWEAVIGLWVWREYRRRTIGKDQPAVGGTSFSRRAAWRLPHDLLRVLHWEHGVLLLLLFGGLAVRLLAVREQLFPLWVDSVRHALITQVMAYKGQVLFDYAPLLPMIDRFPYHFGYHTLSASLLMITEGSLPIMMLSFGQLLNALMPLTIYTAAWLMTRRRDVGLLAAFLVAFPFLFPGYYATWGRFTQLTGMLIMCVLVAMTWRLVRGARRQRYNWWLVGLLAAGLFLVHLRVFLYYLPFPVLIWLYSKGRRTGWLAAAGVLGGLLVAPRISYLMQRSSAGVLTPSTPGYNAFPTGYVTAGWEKYFVGFAAVSLLLVVVGRMRGARWSSLPLLLALWVAALFGLLGGKYVGLPESWLVNLNSMYITLFFPLALLLAITATHLWRKRAVLYHLLHWRALSALFYLPLGALFSATLLFGIRHQITILNEQTILTYRDDMAALEWVAANTPPSARFAVNSWLWLGGTWAGSDGGAWLIPFAERYSSTPPADYIYNLPLTEEVNAFNQHAKGIEDWSAPSVAQWLREQGITHLFVGVKSGFIDPAELEKNPALIRRYNHNGTFVFEVSQ